MLFPCQKLTLSHSLSSRERLLSSQPYEVCEMRDLKPGQKALEYSFKGKKILITGGGRGVGRGLVKRLYEDGAIVYTIEKDENLVEQLKTDFPKARIEKADITDWDETQKLVESFGPLDCVINNAVVAFLGDFMSTTEKNLNLTLNTNLKGVFCVTQAAAKGMIAAGNGGSIVNLSSTTGHVGSTIATAYSVSKAAMNMLTKNLAVELGKYNIRVNTMTPSAISTELFKEKKADDIIVDPKHHLHRQPLAGERVMDIDEAIDAILFLLSPLSAITTGHNLIVDGGISVC